MAFDLGSIKKTRALPPRIVIYGQPGAGKTTLATRGNCVLLPIEVGHGQLEIDAFPSPTTYTEVLQSIESLLAACASEEGKPFAWFVVDGIDRLEALVWEHICEHVPGEKGQKINRIEEFGYGKGYVHATKEWQTFLNGLSALSEAGMGICLIGHDANVKVAPADTDSYERCQLRLDKRAEALVFDWADAVGYLHSDDSAVIEGADGRKRVVGKDNRRVISWSTRPAWRAKNRYGMTETKIQVTPGDLDAITAAWAEIEKTTWPNKN